MLPHKDGSAVLHRVWPGSDDGANMEYRIHGGCPGLISRWRDDGVAQRRVAVVVGILTKARVSNFEQRPARQGCNVRGHRLIE